MKLKYLDAWAHARRRNAEIYKEFFEASRLTDHITLPTEPASSHHIYNQYTIRCPRRDELKAFLAEKRIPSEIYYPYPLHLQKAFSYLGHKDGEFPQTERACREVLSLPICPELGGELQGVVAAITEFYRSH